ncbi:hypothetical protein IFM89_008710 [Coptis chinensis]|uniref:Uncharacterized protein n=1 Tax=Coptis chinensis TaxID=261450 RepID=A0A835LAM2_9MAGN|nr:hypothetical protein IFM89_008710 [Coptis chinensis]
MRKSGRRHTLTILSSHFTLANHWQEQYALPQESLQRSGLIGVGAFNCCRHSPRKHTLPIRSYSFVN